MKMNKGGEGRREEETGGRKCGRGGGGWGRRRREEGGRGRGR